MVFVATLDPVATGLVASLAKPGRNITGMTSISGDLIAKRLQLTRELLPNLTRIAILVRESSPTAAQYVQECRTAARSLGIELQILTERNPQDLEGIFVAVQRSSALVVADDAEFTAHRDQIAELALRNKLPTISGLREMVEAGGFMAYGASFGELYRRAAGQVRKILQGVILADHHAGGTSTSLPPGLRTRAHSLNAAVVIKPVGQPPVRCQCPLAVLG